MSIRSRVLTALPLGPYSQAIGWVAARRWPGPLVKAAITTFVRRFGVDMSESDRDIGEFETFQDFFSRQLRAGARPIDFAASMVSPADGLVVSAEAVESGSTLQAKGLTYSINALLGEPAPFKTGHQITVYLSPRDYHRVHVPCAGTVSGVRRISGRRLPVGVPYAKTIPSLFAKNERVVFMLESTSGKLAVVMVGATGVSAIRPSVKPGDSVRPGDEIGAFLLGSTVVVIWDETVGGRSAMTAGDAVRVGQRIVL